jgi:hypothetical protein
MSVLMKLALTTLLVFVTITWSVRAELVEADDARYGANALTIDTRTGLVWLDLPLSQGLSYSAARKAMEPGLPFEGFRHASIEEIRSLYASAGIEPGFVDPTSPAFPATISLIEKIGATRTTEGFPAAYGISGSLVWPGVQTAALHYGWPSPEGARGYYATAMLEQPGSFIFNVDLASPAYGNWLVVIPEPSVISLGVVAAVLLGCFGRARYSHRGSCRVREK